MNKNKVAKMRADDEIKLFLEKISEVLEETYNRNNEVYISVNKDVGLNTHFYIEFAEVYSGKSGHDKHVKRKCFLKDIDEEHAVYLFEKLSKKLNERGHILFTAPGKMTQKTLKVYQVI